MIFEIDKFYKHTTGYCIAVLGEITTTGRGKGLVAETTDSSEELIQVGIGESFTENYVEISEEEWMQNFS